MKGLHFKLLILFLFFAGTATFFYKHFSLGLPLTPNRTSPVWHIESRLSFDAGTGPIKVAMVLPNRPPNFTLLRENFISPNFSVTTSEQKPNRLATWATRRATGNQNLFYRATFAEDGANLGGPSQTPPKISTTPPDIPEPYRSAADGLIKVIRARSADISTFATETVKLLNTTAKYKTNASVFVGLHPSAKEVVQGAITIMTQANIVAEQINVLILKDQDFRSESHPWLRVWDEEEWLYVNPITGVVGLPENYLIWSYGDQPSETVSGGTHPSHKFAITRDYITSTEVAKRMGRHNHSVLMAISLLNLPLTTQQVYQPLLAIPLGVLIILLLRSFVGIKTFGTFMPVLVALAFRDTKLWWGIALFSGIVAMGLGMRFYLEQFKLLLVPRLAGVLIIVVLLMTVVCLLSFKLNFFTGLSLALFPMVIMTMTIERMNIVWEERGAQEALSQGIGSLFCASLAFLAMDNNTLKFLMFVYPELLLVLLAITLLVGRYHGYRLLELVRFRALSNIGGTA